jgi:hypothetical protein
MVIESIEPGAHDREREETDVGVLVTAWGMSASRLYTGSSDGVLKAWDIQAPPGEAFVRDIVIISGCITAGAFSPDYSRMVLGDSTGCVHLIAMAPEEPGDKSPDFRPSRRPKDILPHKEPQPPSTNPPQSSPASSTHLESDEDNSQEGINAAQEYLRTGQLITHPSKVIGVYQGPSYSDSNLFARYAHIDQDPSKDLLKDFDINMSYRHAEMLYDEEDRLLEKDLPTLNLSLPKEPEDGSKRERDMGHERNLERDKLSIFQDGLSCDFELEFTPSSTIFDEP